jgi:hypothetical protein
MRRVLETLVVVEREGCPIKRCALPGVRAHDAGASSRRQVLGSLWHLDRAPPLWLELGDGLTPLLRHDLKKRSKSKAFWRASMK